MIRSGSKQNDLNKTKPFNQKDKSKKRHVLSSDDEDDVVPGTPVVKPTQQLPDKRKLVNPVDVFGSEPVKQKVVEVIKPKKSKTVRQYLAPILRRVFIIRIIKV